MTSQYEKFMRSRPLACDYVRFDGVYTHNIALKKPDGTYVNVPANVCKRGFNSEHLFTTLARRLIEATEGKFFLNEYVHAVEEPLQHRLYLDLDFPVSDSALEEIATAMEAWCVGPYKHQIARNSESGKVHLTTNILIDSTAQKQITQFLQQYLYEFIEQEYSLDEWKAGFDATACGMRSVYSIKIGKDKATGEENVITSTSYYQPLGELCPETLWKYSIYNKANTISFNSDFWTALEQFLEQKSLTYEPEDAAAIATGKCLPLYGRSLPITQKLIDTLVGALAPEHKNGKAWNTVLWAVKNATQYIEYDATWFLTEWSSEGEGFNAADNWTKWQNLKPQPTKFASALGLLRSRACKHDNARLRSLLYPVPPICDRHNNVFYIDHEKIPQCPVGDRGNKKKYIGYIKDFVINTMALVHNGGNALWVTKNLVHGEIEYTFIPRYKTAEKNLLYTRFVVDWAPGKTEQLEPVYASLLGVAESISKDISYTRLDFIPYAKPDSVHNPERAFNQFTGLISEHDFVPKPKEELEAALCRILYHIREVLCNNDKIAYEYLMHWLAHTVQRPHKKIGVATLVRSQEGAGKSCFWEWFGKFVIGEKYYLSARMEKVVKQFNAISKNNLFTVFEETKNGEGHHHHEDLKQMITDPTTIIEPKGIDSYKTKSYSNYVILTNENYPVKLTANDRRFFCLDANNKHKCDHEYWTILRKDLEGNDAAQLGQFFYEYLQTVDLTNWNHRPVETQLRRDLKIASLPLPIQFLLEAVRGNIKGLQWQGEDPMQAILSIHTETFYNFFRNWEANQDMKMKTTLTSFSRTINEVQASEKLTINKVRKMGYQYVRSTVIAAIKRYLNDTDIEIIVETEEVEEEEAGEELRL